MQQFAINLEYDEAAETAAEAVGRLIFNLKNGEILHFAAISEAGELEVIPATINGVAENADEPSKRPAMFRNGRQRVKFYKDESGNSVTAIALRDKNIIEFLTTPATDTGYDLLHRKKVYVNLTDDDI